MSDSANVRGLLSGALHNDQPNLRTDRAQERKNLRVDVTVFRATELPDLRTWRGKNRRIYATVSGETVKKGDERSTRAVRGSGNTVEWKEGLDDISVHPLSQIFLSLYAEHLIHDVHIGTIKIDPVSTTETLFTLKSSYIPNPVILLTLHVHRNPVDGAIASTEPGNIIRDAQVALNEADDAVKELKICKKWEETIQNIHWVMRTLQGVADVHPFAKTAWEIVSVIPEVFLAQFERDENIVFLVETMHSVYNLTQAEELLQTVKPNSNLALILKVMLRHINICTEIIKRYASDKEFSKRLLTNITGKVNDEIKGLCDTLLRLRRDLVDNAVIDMQIANHFMQKSMTLLTNEVSNMVFDANINELPYRSGWSSTANKSGCLEGTRADFLEYILEWIKNPLSVRGLILLGKAGTGKSSIAFEIASRFCFEEHPASYFAFSRAQKSKQTDHHLFTTIIRDMSDRYSSFKRALGEMIVNNTPLRQSDDLNQLFNILFLTPLEKIDPSEKPELIVIDALDESGDPKKLAAFLSRSLIRLPPNFRILITTRSENDIESCFTITQDITVAPYETIQMDDPKLAANIEDDIRLYFQSHLTTDMFREYGEELAKKAEGLFQWAAVACGYINDPPAGYTENDCLRGLLGREQDDRPYTQELQSTKLYNLYHDVLSRYFTSNITRPRFRSFMGQLLAAFEPVSVNTLTDLRQFVPTTPRDRDPLGSVLAVVKYLGSLLSNATSSDRDLPIVPLHTSFRDYLTNGTDRHPFSVDLATAHNELTCACLDLMLDPDGLRFNIVKLESSHLPNDKVEDLQLRIKKYISPSLFYATRFWDDHLELTSFDKTVLLKLELFFETKFLFWLEVLSVTETVPLAVPAFTSLIRWLQPGLNISEPEVVDRVKILLSIATDAHKFLRYFGNVIATSAPHIYVSALPFSPTSSTIHRFYSSNFPPTLSFDRGQLADWPALEMSIPTSSTPRCAAFSPDGQWIAAGLGDHTIRLWNATTGKLEGKPFIGHTKMVETVAFSPDGLHVLSGAGDSTIRMWNVGTGTIVGEPWIGHDYAVYSVAFAPDGQWAVSGSDDKTIRLWDVAKGTIVGQPLEGHKGPVNSVAFSPNAQRIASGSDDGTIRVWKLNVENGAVKGGPLILHASSRVLSVAFSPDGQQIVSGGPPHTMHIWDNLAGPQAQTTRLTVDDVRPVTSVKYSPDGLHIVAGTNGGDIYMWNTTTKRVEDSPFIGHTHSVHTVAFSPDGQRIVSAGADNMIHVWDAAAAKRVVEEGMISEPPHIGKILCVAVSPLRDNLIAFGNDQTICLWNMDTEEIERPPLVGHTDTILSIQFSPNGLQLVSASEDHTVRLWNVEEGRMVGQPFTGHTSAVCTIAFSPDGRRIVSGSHDHTIRMWNAATGSLEGNPLIGHSKWVNCVQFSPDGRQVVSGSSDYTVRIWDVDKGSEDGNPFTAHDWPVKFAAFLAGGEKVLSCCYNSTVLVWDVATRIVKERFRFLDTPYVHLFACMSIADGTTFIAADLGHEGAIDVWNLATQTMECGPLRGHTGSVSCFAFSPHEPHSLVSGSFDRTVRVWDLASLSVDRGAPVAEGCRPEIDINGIDEEGWLRGTNGELVVWIPRHYRSSYKFPKHVAIYPSDRVLLDFSSFIHGRDWYSHYNP